MPLVSGVLNAKATKGSPIAREMDMWTDCLGCGTTIRLHKAKVDQTDPLETTYRCPECDEVILIVGTPGVVPWEGRGWRMGDWVIRNPRDLHYQGPKIGAPVLMSARPHALD
jgi:hypothetical protein